jgi:hypothetical protein
MPMDISAMQASRSGTSFSSCLDIAQIFSGWPPQETASRAIRSPLARNGHGGALTACLLSEAKRNTSTRDEYFAL